MNYREELDKLEIGEVLDLSEASKTESFNNIRVFTFRLCKKQGKEIVISERAKLARRMK